MKSKWIKIGAPTVALIFMVAFGMISCSSDPMSSPDNGSESYTIASATEASEISTMSTTLPYSMKGFLRISPDMGKCWYLVVTKEEIYELFLSYELNPDWEDKPVKITGSYPTSLKPICSDFPVFKVDKVEVLK